MKLSDLKTFFGVNCLSLRTVKPYNQSVTDECT